MPIQQEIIDKLIAIQNNYDLSRFVISDLEKLVIESVVLIEDFQSVANIFNVETDMIDFWVNGIIERYDEARKAYNRLLYLHNAPIAQLKLWPLTSFTEELSEYLVNQLMNNGIRTLKQCMSLCDSEIMILTSLRNYNMIRPLRQLMISLNLSWPTIPVRDTDIIEPPLKAQVVVEDRRIKL